MDFMKTMEAINSWNTHLYDWYFIPNTTLKEVFRPYNNLSLQYSCPALAPERARAANFSHVVGIDFTITKVRYPHRATV